MNSKFRLAYLGTLLLLGGTLVAALRPSPLPDSLQQPLTTISPEIAGWKMSKAEDLAPAAMQATSYLARSYVKDEDSLGLLIAFHNSHQGAVNVHSPKNCLPGDGWEIWKTASITLPFDGRPVVINQYSVYKMDQRKTVLYWYQSRNRVIANEYLAKLMLMRDGLLEGRTSGSFVRIAMADRSDLIADGLRFAVGVMGQLHHCFRP